MGAPQGGLQNREQRAGSDGPLFGRLCAPTRTRSIHQHLTFMLPTNPFILMGFVSKVTFLAVSNAEGLSRVTLRETRGLIHGGHCPARATVPIWCV